MRLEHLSDVDLSAYILADNQLATLAGWDKEILRIELQNLIAVESENRGACRPASEALHFGFPAWVSSLCCWHPGLAWWLTAR